MPSATWATQRRGQRLWRTLPVRRRAPCPPRAVSALYSARPGHNHPSGDPTPSESDIAMTGAIESACAAIGVALHDHVVIGRETDASFRALGLL